MQENWELIFNKYGGGILIHHFITDIVTLVSNLSRLNSSSSSTCHIFTNTVWCEFCHVAVLQQWKGWWDRRFFCKPYESFFWYEFEAKHWASPNQSEVGREYKARAISTRPTQTIGSQEMIDFILIPDHNYVTLMSYSQYMLHKSCMSVKCKEVNSVDYEQVPTWYHYVSGRWVGSDYRC